MSQITMLVGPLHWQIQMLHLLIGIGAIVMAGGLDARYPTLKRGVAKQAASSQALH